MDPLSEVLSLLKPASHGFRGLDAGPRWALNFPAWPGLKCYAIERGSCLLWIDGEADAILLEAGDLVMLPRGQAYRLGSGRDVPAADALAFFAEVAPGGVATIDGGGHCAGVGGYFGFAGPDADRLLGVLPPVIHLPGTADTAALRAAIARLMQELRDPQPGGALIAGHLAQTLLIEALRAHLRSPGARGANWLLALADRQIALALAAMHAAPAHPWTLATLGKEAGLSRSGFAARFGAVVGEPALAYLTRWRMTLAADRLLAGTQPVSVIARELGYGSESAFGAAFKRIHGIAPRDFARRRAKAGA